MSEHLKDIFDGLPTSTLENESLRINTLIAELVVRQNILIEVLEERLK